MERFHFKAEIRDDQIIISLSGDKYKDVFLSIIIKDIETDIPIWSDSVTLSNDIYYWCTINNMNVYHGFIINIYNNGDIIFDQKIRTKTFSSFSGLTNVKKQCLFIGNIGGMGDELSVEPLIRKINKIFDQKIIVFGYYPQIFINHPCIEKFIKIDTWYALDDVEKNIPEEYLNKDIYDIRYVLRWERDRFGYIPHWTSLDFRQYAALQYGITLKDEEMVIHFYPDDFINIEGMPERYVCINPSVTGSDRIWTIEKWQELINILNENDIYVVSIGKYVENKGVIENLKIKKGLNLCNDERQFSMSQVWHIINDSDMFITFDTGLFIFAGTTDTYILEIGSTGDSEYHYPYRQGSKNYKIKTIKGDCDLKCISDPKYTFLYLGYFGNKGVEGIDRLGKCFYNYDEYKCQPSPNRVATESIYILNILKNEQINKRLNSTWEKCLIYNIEQKPEEYLRLLEYLQKNVKLKNCLEIGSNYGGTSVGFCNLFDNVVTIDIKYNDNFDSIKKEYKNWNLIIGNSQDIRIYNKIKGMNLKFDFIFIDGDHSYDGVKDDYLLYKEFLNDSGIIGFHDIIKTEYNDINNIKVPLFFNELDSFGNKISIFENSVRDNYNHKDYFLDMMIRDHLYSDWGGIGIFEKKIDIMVFSHNYLVNHWKIIVNEQINLLIDSDLYYFADYIYYGVFSENEEDYKDFLSIIKNKDVLDKIVINRYEENNYEYDTMDFLKSKSDKSEKETYILYYHTKGVTSIQNHENESIDLKTIESWRKCLEYFNIEKWKNNINCLKNYDVSGALYQNFGELYNYYYAGNFWWSKSSYIKKLKFPSDMNDRENRMMCEFWIGSNFHNWVNLYTDSWESVYTKYFDPNVYREKN